MKKLHKILTIALALIMILGIAAVPASAVTGEYERVYIVWTEDELRDLSIPRPENEGRYVEIHVVPKNKESDELRTMIYETYESRLKYIGRAVCIILDSSYYNPDGKFNDNVLEAAREAYDRNTDATWKAAIADAFYLDGKNSDSGTETKPELPATTTPVPPVTPPVTTTPATPVKVDSFSDVKPGDWYYDAVMALANSGIVVGFADGTFRPNQTITAGELATILCRIYGADLSKPVGRPGGSTGTHLGHNDGTVNTGHWAENAINYCYFNASSTDWRMCIANMQLNRGWAIGQLAAAFTNGTWSNGTTLSDPSTDETKAILNRIPDVALGDTWDGTEDASHYANYRLTTVTPFSGLTTGEEVVAHDYMCGAGKYHASENDLTAWNAYRIAKAYHIGLVNGVDSTGRCDPWAPVTRAQVVQMLYNMGITSAGQITPVNRDELRNGLSFAYGVG